MAVNTEIFENSDCLFMLCILQLIRDYLHYLSLLFILILQFIIYTYYLTYSHSYLSHSLYYSLLLISLLPPSSSYGSVSVLLPGAHGLYGACAALPPETPGHHQVREDIVDWVIEKERVI